MRRAVVSIASNIAEGKGRRTDGEFLNQLSVAHGSLCELETQILLTERLNLIAASESSDLVTRCAEVGRLVHGLMRSIEQ
jgi:four helix bundle protein